MAKQLSKAAAARADRCNKNEAETPIPGSGNSSFMAAIIKMVEKAVEIATTFNASGHQEAMTDLQRQYFERVTEFLDAVDRDRQPQTCDGCGRGSAKIGECCDHCGDKIECAAR